MPLNRIKVSKLATKAIFFINGRTIPKYKRTANIAVTVHSPSKPSCVTDDTETHPVINGQAVARQALEPAAKGHVGKLHGNAQLGAGIQAKALELDNIAWELLRHGAHDGELRLDCCELLSASAMQADDFDSNVLCESALA